MSVRIEDPNRALLGGERGLEINYKFIYLVEIGGGAAKIKKSYTRQNAVNKKMMTQTLLQIGCLSLVIRLGTGHHHEWGARD